MTAAEVAELLDLAELVLRLDLEPPRDHQHLAGQLRACRADHLEALTHSDPGGVSASALHLRAVRWNEIGVCEGALDQLGEPYDVEVSEEGDGV